MSDEDISNLRILRYLAGLKLTDGKAPGHSVYRTAQTSIGSLWTMRQNRKCPERVQSILSHFNNGKKQQIVTAKANGEMKAREGKRNFEILHLKTMCLQLGFNPK